VQGVATEVGPHRKKLMLPVGEPAVEFPVTVAVSIVLPLDGMVVLLSEDLMVGVYG
jgi:hypothetical protein